MRQNPWPVNRRPAVAPSRPASGLLKQQGSEFGQVAPPDHPAVRSRRFEPGIADILGSEPFEQLLVAFDKAILLATSNPEEAQPPVGLSVQPRECGVQVVAETAGAESADPGELAQGVQSGEKRFSP